MAAFDLQESLRRAEARLERKAPGARTRRDRGQSRLAPEVSRKLDELLQGQERPPVRAIQSELRSFCRARGLRPPARSTLYQLMDRLPPRGYAIADLPAAVRQTLYNFVRESSTSADVVERSPEGRQRNNLPSDTTVPGHQLAFHCLNYGGLEAMSFAAGLPWLALHQAAQMRGWRPRSRGLLEAILHARGLR